LNGGLGLLDIAFTWLRVRRALNGTFRINRVMVESTVLDEYVIYMTKHSGWKKSWPLRDSSLVQALYWGLCGGGGPLARVVADPSKNIFQHS